MLKPPRLHLAHGDEPAAANFAAFRHISSNDKDALHQPHGRDAADVPLIHSFGPHVLDSFLVWTDEVAEPDLQKLLRSA